MTKYEQDTLDKITELNEGILGSIARMFMSSKLKSKYRKAYKIAKDDPELWQLMRTESLELARQKEYNDYGLQLVATDVSRLERLKKAFETFDADGSGFLDELISQSLHHVAASPGIDHVRDACLFLQDQLSPHALIYHQLYMQEIYSNADSHG